MYLHVRMVKAGYPSLQKRVVKIECVVYQNTEVAELRHRGYEIASIEIKDGRD
jgi:hypothetical protein